MGKDRRSTSARSYGFSLLELVLAVAIMSILTAASVPLIRNSVKRDREIELRYALRQIREAIDAYKHYGEFTNGAAIPVELRTQSGYPKDLKTLVDGFTPANVVGTSQNKIRFLRRMPIDPMTGKDEWGLRGYQDRPGDDNWGGDDVYDVYSLSPATALNGTLYKDW
ncbi:MAG TPA: type II secretion system protein [Blastocatellia bacterium]